MAADLTKAREFILDDLVGVNGSTPAVKDIIKAAGATSANPADFTAVTGASALTTAAVTVVGVAVGDIVLGWGVVSGLATNQFVVAAYVSATDTVTLVIGNALNTTVTTTAVVVNLIIADVT